MPDDDAAPKEARSKLEKLDQEFDKFEANLGDWIAFPEGSADPCPSAQTPGRRDSG